MGKLQHYVPRFYLRAWAHKERVYCLQDNVIRHPNIKGVCAENYFYRLRELSPDDVQFLREGLIKGSPEGLKAWHEGGRYALYYLSNSSCVPGKVPRLG